jgi:hypothetical protein
MFRKSVALGSSLVATLAIVGCQDQVTAPMVAPDASIALPSLTGVTLNRGALVLPSSARIGDVAFSTAAARAINPTDYTCSDASPLNGWLDDQIVTTLTKERALFLALYLRSADLVPTYDALYYGSSATPLARRAPTGCSAWTTRPPRRGPARSAARCSSRPRWSTATTRTGRSTRSRSPPRITRSRTRS